MVIRFIVQPVLNIASEKTKAGIKVTAAPKAVVFIDGKEVGSTPFQDETLISKQYHIQLKEGQAQWQSRVKLNPGTITVINRELSADAASSSGELLTLSSGKGVIITSTPAGAEVEIDGKIYGKTPISIPSLPVGSHTFLLNKAGYLKRNIKANLPKGFTLTLAVDMAISEADLSTVTAPSITVQPEVVVNQTPVGFLRVREKPATTAKEIDRVSPGQTLSLLQELAGWVKVKLPNGNEGYVFSAYVTKK